MKKISLILIIIIAILFLIFACSVTSSGSSESGDGSSDGNGNSNAITIVYNGNGNTGGTAPIDNSTYSSGTTIIVLANTGAIIKAGYIFSGWNTASDGSGVTYLEGNTFIGTSNVILYAKWDVVSYNLGDVGPAGGHIFYINANAATDGWKYLEAAPSDQSSGEIWSNVTSTLLGTTGTDIGTGKSNTAAIIAQSGHIDSAAKLCDDLEIINADITYSDWFLPSKDELNFMYENIDLSGGSGFSNEHGWSSSESTKIFAWLQCFTNGNQESYNKMSLVRVRACRQF